MLVQVSEGLHDALWQIADCSMLSPGDSVKDRLFSNTLLEMTHANVMPRSLTLIDMLQVY